MVMVKAIIFKLISLIVTSSVAILILLFLSEI